MEFKDLNDTQTEKVINRYIKYLELLSLQFGVHPNDLEPVLKQIIEKCRTAKELNKNTIYRIAVDVLQLYFPSESEEGFNKDGKKIFLFEEDEKFHHAVGNLMFDIKVPYILTVFHGFTIPETSSLLHQSEEFISHSIEEAKQQLIAAIPIQHEQYEKALEFLKKTYSRLPELTDRQHLFSENSISEDIIPSGKEEEKKEKRAFLLQMVGAASAVILFIALFFISSTNNGQVDDQYLTRLDEEFNSLMDDRRQKLGLSQAVFGQLSFVANARSLNSLFQSEVNKSIESEEPMKRKVAKQKFKEVADSFQLPSEMIEGLKDEHLTGDQEASLTFIDDYGKRLHQVRGAYYMESGLYKSRNELPDALIKAMKEQNLYISNDADYLTIEFRKSDCTKILESTLHKTVKPYIKMLVLEGSIYAQELLSPSELAVASTVLEEIILDDHPQQAYLYDTAKNLYRIVLSRLTYGPSIYQKDMTIRKDYIAAWESLAKRHDTSPMGAIFSEIIEGIAMSNPTTLRTLDPHLDLERAISLMQKGELASYSGVERQFDEMEKFTKIDLPNDDFNMDISKLVVDLELNSEIGSRAISVLQNPLNVVGAYDYAQREENWKLLYGASSKYYQFDDFKESHIMGKPILDGVTSIVFDPEWIHYNPTMVAPIFFVRDGKSEIGVWIIKWGQGPQWVVDQVVD
ncbi:hypothetical protein ACFOZY_13010 [Chungangia koreensis]|uniref:Uncharacterized protein n=1 Tax=Chungangia koreensis TaxID=752657 RepID=A0ABV8X6E1_9LACT